MSQVKGCRGSWAKVAYDGDPKNVRCNEVRVTDRLATRSDDDRDGERDAKYAVRDRVPVKIDVVSIDVKVKRLDDCGTDHSICLAIFLTSRLRFVAAVGGGAGSLLPEALMVAMWPDSCSRAPERVRKRTRYRTSMRPRTMNSRKAMPLWSPTEGGRQ